MRISTTLILLTSALFFFTAIDAFAAPGVTITAVKHACGEQANGSFIVNVTSASGPNLRIRIIGAPPFTDIDTGNTPMPALPFAFPVNNLPGNQTYLVVVQDNSGFSNAFVSISDFTVKLDAAVNNTNPGCATPNGAISVTTTGSSPAGPITYLWTGPGGPYNTEDISGLRGGDYSLSYSDGTTTCTLGPIHIDDPQATPFTITASSNVCANNGFNVDVSTADNGYTYTVLEGATVLASAPGTGGPLSIAVAALPVGPHTLRVQASAGVCPPRFNDAPDVTITVNPAPDYNSYNNDAAPGGICSNTALGVNLLTLKKASSVAADSFTIISISSAGLTAVAGSPATGSGFSDLAIADDVWKNTTNGNLDVVYTIGTFAGVCPGNVITVRATIKPQPDYNNYNNDLLPGGVCSRTAIGVTLDPLKKGTSVLATSYNITNIVSTFLTATGGSPSTAVGANSNVLADDQWQNVTNAPVDVVYTVVPIVAGCQGDPFTVRVTIVPQPDYNNYNNSLVPGGICSSDLIALDLDALKKAPSVAATSYNITNINSTGLTAIGGSPATGTGLPNTAIADDQWRNVTTGNVNVVYTIAPVRGSCVGNPFTVTITIKPEPDYNNFTNPGGICSDAVVGINLNSLAKVTSSLATAYDITSIVSTDLTPKAGNPVTGTNLTASEIADDVWENLTNGQRTATYTILPKTGVCAGTPFTVAVTVNPEPNVKDYDSAPGGVCSGDALGLDLATLAEVGSVAASTYQITSIAATGLTPSGGSPGTGPGFTANAIADDVWTNTTAGALPVVYSITPFNGTCAGDPFTVTISIVPRPSFKDYNNDLVAGGVCATTLGIDLNTLKNAGSPDATAFNITSIVSTGLVAVSGSPATGNGLTNTAIADDQWSNLTTNPIDVVYTIVPLNGLCAGTAFTVTVTIKPQPDYASGTDVNCSSEVIGYDLNTTKSVTGVTATSFDITAITIPTGLTATAGAPATGTGFAAGVIADDVWQNLTANPLDVIYTVTPFAGTCAGVSFTVTVTINPEPVYNNTTLADICSQGTITTDLDSFKAPTSVTATNFTLTAAVPAGLTAVGATPTTGSGDHLVLNTHEWRNATNAVLTLVYTIIPESTLGCDGLPFTVTVKINPQPDYNNYNNNVAPGGICSNTALGLDLATLQKGTSVAATTFNIVSITSTGLVSKAGTPVAANGLTSAEIADDVWENTSNGNLNVVYTITPQIGPCVGDPFTVTFTILPQPEYDNNAPVAICSDDAVGIDLLSLKKATSIAATTYNITSITSTSLTAKAGSPATGTGLAANVISDDRWENLTNGPLNVVYTVVPVGGTCAGAPFTVTVTINPEPVGADAAISICSNNVVAYDFQTSNIDALGNGLAGTSFSWVAAAQPNVTGESTSPKTDPTITDILVNTTATDQVVVYTVTPTGGTCVGSTFSVSVTVSPQPVLVVGQTAEACSGSPINYEILLNPVNLPAGTTFSWPDPDGIGPATAGVNVPMGTAGTIHITDVITNLSSTPLAVTYVVTPSVGGSCNGVPQNVVININQPAIVEAGGDQAICFDNGPYTLVGASVSGAATSGTWTIFSQPVGGDGIVSPLTAMASPATATFTGTVPGNYVLQLTSDDPAGVCGPVLDIVTITVTEKPVIAAGQSKTVCPNDPIGYEILMNPLNTPAGTVFNWPDPDGIGPATAGVNVPMGTPGTLHLADVLINNGTSDLVVTYTITPSVGLCVGAPETVTITVRPSPVLALGQAKTICSGDLVDYEILLTPGNSPAGTTFSWPDPDGAGPATSKLNVPADPAGTIHITDRLFNGTGTPIHVIYSVIARGPNGCAGIPRDIDITVNSGAIVEAGNAQAVCSNGTATLGGATFGGLATEATWSILSGPVGGDGDLSVDVASTTPETVTFKATVAGDYTLQLATDDPAGACSAVTDVVVITVRPVGDPSCTGGSGTCANVSIQPVPTPATCSNSDGSVFFNISPAIPVSGDVTITIDGTGSTVLPSPRTNINNPTFATLAVGTYTYTILYGDAGCIKTGFFSIDRSGTIGTASVSNLIDPVCFGGTGTATINVPGETGNILQWSVNGIDFHNFVAGNPVANLPGGLIAVQRAGDPCAAGVMVNFTMPAEIPVTFVGTSASCSNNDGTIEVTNLTGGPYVFELNGVQTNLPADNVFRGLVSDDYTLLVRDTKGCTKTYLPINIGQIVGPSTLDTLYVKKAISAPDLGSGSALVGVKPSGLEPYETRLELVQPLFASQQYLSDWSEVSVNPQNLKFEKSYTNIFAGVYTLGLRDAGGCTKQFVINIDVDTDLLIPNVFTPNGDGHNEVFYIRNLPSSDAKLLITNRWGKEVYKTSSYQNDWNGGDTVDGIYYYKLTLGSQSFAGWVEILRGQ